MLNIAQRFDRYLAQTGRNDLTPRQRRRWEHKVGHQSAEAAAHREDAAKARTVQRERRKSRLAGLSFAR